MFLYIFLIVLFTAFTTFLLNSFLIKKHNKKGSNIIQSENRWSKIPKPTFGGISIYVVFSLGIVLLAVYSQFNSLRIEPKFWGLIITLFLGFIMGFADDKYNTKPKIKATVQLICGLILWFSGFKIEMSPYFIINISVTVFWTFFIMNSINMLDNMDAISASVSVMIAVQCLILSFSNILSFETLIISLFVGALIGFLIHNWNPSKLFMGDSGSQFLGVFLAYLGINFFGTIGHTDEFGFNFTGILAIVCFFTPTLVDTITVTINRIMRGSSPFVGGRDHTTHHLHYLGFNERKIALIFALLSILPFIIDNYVLTQVRTEIEIQLFYCTYFVFVFVSLYSITKYNEKKNIKG